MVVLGNADGILDYLRPISYCQFCQSWRDGVRRGLDQQRIFENKFWPTGGLSQSYTVSRATPTSVRTVSLSRGDRPLSCCESPRGNLVFSRAEIPVPDCVSGHECLRFIGEEHEYP
jgi:hypothetical protein